VAETTNATTSLHPSAGRQRFDVGYHLNTWDLAGLPAAQAFHFLSDVGFRWFEALIRDSLGADFERRFMTLERVGLPLVMTDVDMLGRLATFAEAERSYGLKISSLYANPTWIDPDLWPAERATMITIARFLKGCGAPILVAGGGPHARAGQDHTSDEYAQFAHALEEIGRDAAELGLRLAYHPHLDCFIETREQLDRLMDIVNTDYVGLCIDTAHLTVKGSDPVDAIRTYFDHVHYLHFKDAKFDPSLEGWARYLSFRELGQGDVDFPALTHVLLEQGFSGIAMIELDVSQKSAEQSCLESVEFLHDELGIELNALPIDA
jgi:inosose dehydratase